MGHDAVKAFGLLSIPALALLLLAAHFYRAGLWPLSLVALLLVGLLFVPRAWAARATQIALVVGVIEWLRTLAALAGAAQVFRAYPLRVRFGLGSRF